MAVAFAESFCMKGKWEGSDDEGTKGQIKTDSGLLFTPRWFKVADRKDKQSLFDAVMCRESLESDVNELLQ